MKNLALLLTVSVLLLLPALPTEALSLNYSFHNKMNSQHFHQSDALTDGKVGTEAIPQRTSTIDQPEIFSPDFSSYKGISEESMLNLKMDSQPPTPELVPEPATLILLGSGLIGLAVLKRRLTKLNS